VVDPKPEPAAEKPRPVDPAVRREADRNIRVLASMDFEKREAYEKVARSPSLLFSSGPAPDRG
jgi:hypothetical protein